MAIHCAIIHENHTQAMSTVPKTPSLVDSGLCDKSRCLLLRCIVPVCWLDWSRYWAGFLKKLLVQQIWVTSTNTEVTGACWGHVLSIDYAVCYWSTWPRRTVIRPKLSIIHSILRTHPLDVLNTCPWLFSKSSTKEAITWLYRRLSYLRLFPSSFTFAWLVMYKILEMEWFRII